MNVCTSFFLFSACLLYNVCVHQFSLSQLIFLDLIIAKRNSLNNRSGFFIPVKNYYFALFLLLLLLLLLLTVHTVMISVQMVLYCDTIILSHHIPLVPHSQKCYQNVRYKYVIRLLQAIIRLRLIAFPLQKMRMEDI